MIFIKFLVWWIGCHVHITSNVTISFWSQRGGGPCSRREYIIVIALKISVNIHKGSMEESQGNYHLLYFLFIKVKGCITFNKGHPSSPEMYRSQAARFKGQFSDLQGKQGILFVHIGTHTLSHKQWGGGSFWNSEQSTFSHFSQDIRMVSSNSIFCSI